MRTRGGGEGHARRNCRNSSGTALPQSLQYPSPKGPSLMARFFTAPLHQVFLFSFKVSFAGAGGALWLCVVAFMFLMQDRGGCRQYHSLPSARASARPLLVHRYFIESKTGYAYPAANMLGSIAHTIEFKVDHEYTVMGALCLPSGPGMIQRRRSNKNVSRMRC